MTTMSSDSTDFPVAEQEAFIAAGKAIRALDEELCVKVPGWQHLTLEELGDHLDINMVFYEAIRPTSSLDEAVDCINAAMEVYEEIRVATFPEEKSL